MAIQWFVQHGGKQYGPLTSSSLKKLADEGKISPATQVRSGAEGAWVPAARVQGLFAATQAPAAGAPATTAPRAAAAQPAKVASPPVAPPPAPLVARPLARSPLAKAAMAPLPKAVPAAGPGAMTAKILGAVGLIFGILALATCWLPVLGGMMGWTAIVVGGLGLLLGIAALVMAARHKGSGLALGIAGSSSSLVGLVLSAVLGSHFGLFGRAPMSLPPAMIPVAAVPSPPTQAPPPPPPVAEPEPEPVWTDAGESIDQPPIKASIVSAKIEAVRLENTDLSMLKKPKPQMMLKIRVAIENTSSDKIVEFPGWSGSGDLIGQGVGELLGSEAGKALQSATASSVLVDNAGNKYKQTPGISIFGGGLSLGKDNSVRPGAKAETDLVFPRPLDSIEYLRLELSPAGFGGSEPLRFEIPKSMIGGLN